ncbi:MAG UNVERIFIED_CONTAM: hypothetical protein LVR18_43715 [Planctomycetaceae bacterium]
MIWREMRTRAYGRRMIWIKLAYMLLTCLIAVAAWQKSLSPNATGLVLGMVSGPAFAAAWRGHSESAACERSGGDIHYQRTRWENA